MTKTLKRVVSLSINLEFMFLLLISLLSILAGTLLLLKTKKEELGKFFAFISWFFLVVGFLLFIGFLAGGINRLAHGGRPGHPGFQREMMMRHPAVRPHRMMRPMHPGMNARECCPGMMAKDCCNKKGECMKNDSTMKCCPMHMSVDSMKLPVAKPE
jgi:hypothetical protein